ncbi:Protein kinase-like domain containing protein [Rhypophila decipiens]
MYTAAPPLRYKLKNALLPKLDSDPIHENSIGSRFLSHELICKEVTAGSISATLAFTWSGWFQSLWARSFPDQVVRQARKVFAILVLIDHGPAIRELVNDDRIDDGDLPLSSEFDDQTGKTRVFSVKTGKQLASFGSWPRPQIQKFLDKQWFVQVPILITGQHLKIKRRLFSSLPVLKSGLVKTQGHNVLIHEATLHPDYASFSSSDSPVAVAIKVITDKEVFEREKANLDSIIELEHDNLIKLLASVEEEQEVKGGAEKSMCYYLIFKWASGGCLEDFWGKHGSMPRNDILIKWSLKEVLGLVDAVRILHENGIRHGDIKPQNILHFTPDNEGLELGKLVLADVGISKYHHDNTNLRSERTQTDESTRGYEAPEADDGHCDYNHPRSRGYDMWSMGCVLLEFTVWLLYGPKAIKCFRKQRIRFGARPRGGDAAFFHRDTMKLHPKVVESFSKLREDPRCGKDTALASLLTLIETQLLKTDPKDRITARKLHEKLNVIVQRATKDSSSLCNWTAGRHFKPSRGLFRKPARSTQASGSLKD